jgi:hypothetical protein
MRGGEFPQFGARNRVAAMPKVSQTLAGRDQAGGQRRRGLWVEPSM